MLKNNFFRALIDCWGIFLVNIARACLLKSNSIFPSGKLSISACKIHFSWLIRQIIDVIDPDEYSVTNIIFCYSTMYAIIMLCMFTFMLLIIIIYSFDHKMYTILAFIAAILILFVELQQNYSSNIQITVISLFILYAFYRIDKSLRSENPGSKIVAETADNFLQFGFSFYIKLMIQLITIHIKSLYIRLLNFNDESYWQRFLMGLFLAYYTYSEIFVTQAFTAQTLSRKVYKDSPSFRYEIIAMFFTTATVAFVKIFFIFTNNMYYLAFELLGTNFIQKNKFMKAFEDDRCFFFYIIFVRTSFFEGFFNWRRNFWQGELKKNMRKLSLKQDIFPMLVIMFIFFKFILQGYKIIRPVELLFIIPCNTFVFVEIFNTYAVMKILEYNKTTYFEEGLLPIVDCNNSNALSRRESLRIRKSKIKLHDFFNNNFFNKKLIKEQESLKPTFGYFGEEENRNDSSISSNS